MGVGWEVGKLVVQMGGGRSWADKTHDEKGRARRKVPCWVLRKNSCKKGKTMCGPGERLPQEKEKRLEYKCKARG